MRIKKGKKIIAVIVAVMMVLLYLPPGLFGGITKALARTKVHVNNGDTIDISSAGKNTIFYIDDDTANDNGTGTVYLKGSSTYVWVHIEVSSGKTVTVNLLDGLNINPGYNSSYGTGKAFDTLGYSRSAIYIDETSKSGGTVILKSAKNARINLSSYREDFYYPVPAIMKNDSKTKLVFETEDVNNPGTIICKPKANGDGAVAIGAFGHGVLGIATSSYKVGNIDFHSGNIEAYGLYDGAGIGAYHYSHVGSLSFSGAHVVAKSGNGLTNFILNGGPGIGTSYRGNIDKIEISGGYVEAWGYGSLNDEKGRPMKYCVDNAGCGIGVGILCHMNELLISGGTVKAYGGSSAGDKHNSTGCGIGTLLSYGSTSSDSTADNISITGGDITASGGDYTCGIGGCVGNIVINPETPDTELKINAFIEDKVARGGRHHTTGCGIGIGNNIYNSTYSKYPGNIIIKGGDITATAGPLGDTGYFADGHIYMGSGIGPVRHGRVSTIQISGGRINAYGGWSSPGIGGDYNSSDNCGVVDSIHITGGTVTATHATSYGDKEPLSGIGGCKSGCKERTDIFITGGSVIANGSDFAIGYDFDGQPKNDAGEKLYGTKFKFKPDTGEWTEIKSIDFDPELDYHYNLDDTFTKKGLDRESGENIIEVWIPEKTDGYKCIVETADHAYISVNPEKVKAGDETELYAGTKLKYVNKLNGENYTGLGIYGEKNLTINPAPSSIARYKLTGYADENNKRVANGTYGEDKPQLIQSTNYVDTDGKWKAKDKNMSLLFMLEQTEYLVKYDANKPKSASHDITGSMDDDSFPVSGTSILNQNQYNLPGWEFTGWNTKPDGTGTSYADKSGITFGNWDSITLYAQWKPKKYIVTFDPGAAVGQATYTQEFEYDIPSKLTANTFSYDGHGFHGWQTLALGSFYEDQELVKNVCTLESDGSVKGKTLYAEWIDSDMVNILIIDNGSFVTAPDPGNILLKDETGIYQASFEKSGFGYYAKNIPAGTYTVEFTGDLADYRPQEEVVVVDGRASSYVWNYYTLKVNSGNHCMSYFDDGTGSTTLEHVPEEETIKITTTTDPGYKFSQYACSGMVPEWEEGHDDWPTQTIKVNGSAEITSSAAPVNYTVNYDKNKPGKATYEVEGSMNDQSFVYDEEQKLSENEYTLQGWTFVGWNTSADGSGTPISDKDMVKNLTTIDGSIVKLYAQWEQNKYKVYFSATSATSGSMAPQELIFDDEEALSKNMFERTDWEFISWNTEPAGGGDDYSDGQTVKNLTLNKSITLYAQWEHDYYSVIFDKNDADAMGEMPDEHVWTNIEYQLSLNRYYKNGYCFDSWNTKADGSGTKYTDGATIENLVAKGEAIVLYAQWKPNKYSVKFDPNTGTGKMDDQNFTYDVADKLSANKFLKEHHTFSEWNTKPDGSGNSYKDKEEVKNLTIYPDDTVTLYARWTLEKHVLKYDLNGGTLDGKTGVIELNYDYGDIVTLPEPTREGYTFEYWEGSRYYAGDMYTVTEDHTLTAQWKKSSEGEGGKEEKKDDPTKPVNPNNGSEKKSGKTVNTGDNARILMWFALLGLSALGVIAVIALKRKKLNR